MADLVAPPQRQPCSSSKDSPARAGGKPRNIQTTTLLTSHARLKNFADGSTYRVIDPDMTMVCLFSGGATECWAMDQATVA